MQLAVRPFDAFDGDDLAPAHAVGQRRAGIRRHIVEHHRAVPAFGMIAAELGAGEAELVAQRMDQRFVREHVDGPIAAVDVERDEPRYRARSLRKRLAGASHDHIAGGRYGNTRCNHALDELAPRGAKAWWRTSGRLASILAMDITRGSLVVLWHDCSSLFEMGAGQ